LRSYDAAAVASRAGVRIVREGDLLAAVAADAEAARRAAMEVHAVWDADPLAAEDDWPALFTRTAVAPVEQPRARYPPLLQRGDVVAALAAASATKTSQYRVHPIAHVPLEPRAAVADWKDGTVTIHSGSQAPFLVRQEVARALDVAVSQVRVIAVDPGGAFGGKQRGECEVEAARMSRIMGAPVRVAWTREEEFTCSYTRPAGLVALESGVDARGRLAVLRMANYNSGAAGLASPYEIPTYWIGFHRTEAPVRQGSYRSLAAVANTFARESHMDEWAETLKVDPVAFRLRHVSDTRLRDVVTQTAARFGWGDGRAETGRGVGMSCTIEKDARLALCVEVRNAHDDLRVTRIVATGDFGPALNPGHLENQMTGAIIQGLGGALWERVRYAGDKQLTRRLSQYRVPRFRDMPDVFDVQIVDRRGVDAAGAGESPITLVAPALASAIAAATGERRRTLPLLA
jgi:isoquinoline 1-oxidoreductase